MEKNVKNIQSVELNKEMKKQALQTFSDTKMKKTLQEAFSFLKKKIPVWSCEIYGTPNSNKILILLSILALFFSNTETVLCEEKKVPSKPEFEFLKTIGDTVVAFVQIWSWQQWVWSIVSLIIIYWISGYYYNKWLQKTTRGYWLPVSQRLLLIQFDLTTNFFLGLYYMHHRDSVIGGIMMRCPIAISPLIFICELICVTLYYQRESGTGAFGIKGVFRKFRKFEK